MRTPERRAAWMFPPTARVCLPSSDLLKSTQNTTIATAAMITGIGISPT